MLDLHYQETFSGLAELMYLHFSGAAENHSNPGRGMGENYFTAAFVFLYRTPFHSEIPGVLPVARVGITRGLTSLPQRGQKFTPQLMALSTNW